MDLPDALYRLSQMVGARVPDARVMVVGGAVRDAMFGVSIRDWDLEVFGVPGDQLEGVLQELFPLVKAVGAAFCVFRIPLEDGAVLDVTLPRRESKVGKGHRGFMVEGDPLLPLQDALRRRDFTMNAMAWDVVAQRLEDPFDGQRDIAAHVLRAVDARTFVEDPLRVLRAAQLSARFSLTVEPATMELLHTMAATEEFAELSLERVGAEWMKMMSGEMPARGLQILHEVGATAAAEKGRQWMERFYQRHHPVLVRAPIAQGRDLLALGVPPGPEMGEMLKRLEEARDHGEIATRAEALALAQQWL